MLTYVNYEKYFENTRPVVAWLRDPCKSWEDDPQEAPQLFKYSKRHKVYCSSVCNLKE